MASYIGHLFGNYRLTKFLGTGAFGDVYLGEHIDDKSLAAIKVLKTHLTNPKDLREFINEARSFRLRHPHIVQLLDFGVGNADIPFLVMDYAPGGSLNQRHPYGEQLPLGTILTYVKQIASALQYAHNQRSIHRDVKPENMLFGKNKALLISDFGIAVMAHGTKSGTDQNIAGTPFYMAPEQFRGRAEPASDQYALGVVVYEWICGVRLFTADAPSPEERFLQLGYQHNHIPPPFLSQKVVTVSPAVEQVILKALAKEPAGRFRRIEEFAQALEDAQSTKSEQAKQPQQSVFSVAQPGSSLYTVAVPTSLPAPLDEQEQRRRRDLSYKLYHIAEGLIRQGRYEKALEAYEQILQLDPASTQALKGKGLLLFQLGKHQAGLDLLDEALRLDPNDKFTLADKARLLVQLGRQPEGTAIFDELIRLDQSGSSYFVSRIAEQKVEALAQYVNVLMQNKALKEAIVIFDQIIGTNRQYGIGLEEVDSGNDQVEKYRYPYEARAKALYDLRKYEETIKACDEILRLSASAAKKVDIKSAKQCRRLDDPTVNDSTHVLKAQALENLGKIEEALSSYRQVFCQLSPEVRKHIGWALEKLGKYQEALEEYEIAYKELPQDKEDILTRKGRCLLILGKKDQIKYNEAQQVFDALIELGPTNWNAWRSKGVAFEQLRKYEEALDSYNQAIQLMPTNKGLLKRKAEVLTQLSRFEEALDIYKQL